MTFILIQNFRKLIVSKKISTIINSHELLDNLLSEKKIIIAVKINLEKQLFVKDYFAIYAL